jgi:ribosomal protein L12E/L44/L45/RPP1/RPP2
MLFANALKGQNVVSLLSNLSGAAPVAAATSAGGAPTAAVEEKKEEKKKDEKEDEDVLEGGLGFDEEW